MFGYFKRRRQARLIRELIEEPHERLLRGVDEWFEIVAQADKEFLDLIAQRLDEVDKKQLPNPKEEARKTLKAMFHIWLDNRADLHQQSELHLAEILAIADLPDGSDDPDPIRQTIARRWDLAGTYFKAEAATIFGKAVEKYN